MCLVLLPLKSRAKLRLTPWQQDRCGNLILERKINIFKERVKKISISSQSYVKDSPRFCLSQANSFLWCSLYFRTAKQSNVGLSCLHLYRQGKIFLLPFSITYCMSFCCLLGGFVFYYKFGTIYYCLVFVLCLKNESTFFFIMDKMLRWLEVISIWLSEIFIVPFILCTRFLASFFSPYCHNVEFSMCLPFHLYARSKQRLFQFQVIKINWTFDLISKSVFPGFFTLRGGKGKKEGSKGLKPQYR